MSEYCRGCLEEIKFGEKGTCWHEAGYGHHLACPVNPEAEDELTDLVATDQEANNSSSNPQSQSSTKSESKNET